MTIKTTVPVLDADPWALPPERARVGDWMCTYTGRKFYPLDPHPQDVDIQDIAHALSNICRFGGHCAEFYSVAQHSVLVSVVLTSQDFPCDVALWGLLHDAAEAYVGDVIWPLKRSTLMDGHKAVEARVMEAVAGHFGLPMPEPAAVKAADLVLLSTEKRDLMGGRGGENTSTQVELAAARHAGRVPWHTDVTPMGARIEPWSPARAAREFLRRFEEVRA